MDEQRGEREIDKNKVCRTQLNDVYQLSSTEIIISQKSG